VSQARRVVGDALDLPDRCEDDRKQNAFWDNFGASPLNPTRKGLRHIVPHDQRRQL
jgi:hypothetical protein